MKFCPSRYPLLGLLVCFFAAFPAPASASTSPGDDAPPWVQQAAAIKIPNYEKDVQAVVLLDESNTTISSDGKVYNYACGDS